MTEAELQKCVTDTLDLGGWLWTHFRPASTAKGWRTALEGTPGFPDIVAVRSWDLWFIELKSDRGRLSMDQLRWHDALKEVFLRAGIWSPDATLIFGPRCHYEVWRPDDWESGYIVKTLLEAET